jgi:GNAT superfamily N-acetyltransferase
MSGEHGRYRVRLARRGDLHGLPQIERRAARRFFDGGYGSLLGSVRPSLETLERRQFLGRVWVAAQQHEGVVAFATASLIDGNAHLDDLHVDPAHGSMGLGTRLIEAVCTWAWRAAATAVTLSTLREVPWNEPFYSKRGFRTLGESELGRGLRELRELEARAGLPVAERVMMVRELL